VRQFCRSDFPWYDNQTAIDLLSASLQERGVTDVNALALVQSQPVCSIIPRMGYMPCGQGLGCVYSCSPGMWCTDDQARRDRCIDCACHRRSFRLSNDVPLCIMVLFTQACDAGATCTALTVSEESVNWLNDSGKYACAAGSIRASL